MSGFLRKAALVVGAVALVAATAGAAAGALAPAMAGSASVAGISAGTLTAIGTYGALTAGVLSMAAQATAPGPTVQGSATTFTTNPQSGLPYVMGRTRMSGLRIFADTNTRAGYTKFNDLLWFGALLSIGGQIDSIEKFTADNEIVTFDAGGNAIGDYHDYQAQKIHMGGSPQASALALTLMGSGAPGWTSEHKLSGITHAMWCLRFNKQGEMYGAGAPEPAWIGKWVKVYDPRLDSTYPGGAGACRPLIEATYVWSQNPGLHALTWALGRWQNGKRTCGIGAPVANIRVSDFVECANVCDANGWKVGGTEWTTDSKWDTFKRILQAGGARPTRTGAMIGCIVNTPRTAIATIESRHLHDGLTLPSTKSRRDRFNSVIPRYVDEDSEWAIISGSAVTVGDYVTADRGQRTKEIDYPLVQVFSGEEATQPGQLAAYDIVNSREAGPFTWTTGPEWIGLKTGDVVLLNVPEEGLVNQPVLITRRAPDPSTGKVSFAAETETPGKHAFALGQTTTPPPPFSLSAPDLKPPAPAETAWAVSGNTSGEGFPALIVTGESEMPSADAVVIDYKLSSDSEWSNSAILSAVDPVSHVISPLQSETAYDVRIAYRVGTIDGNMTIFVNVMTGLGKVTIIDGRLNDMDAQLAQLESDTAAAQVAIGNAQAEIDAAQAEIDAAVADIAAQGSAISTIEANVATNTGDIELLAEQIQALDPDSLAELSNKLGVMASANETVAGALLAATIKTSQQSAAFASERTLRANSEEVIARSVEAINVRMGAAEAGISSEATIRATADTALSNRIDTVTASVGTNSAAITSEASARATADTALSNQINSVSATADANTAAITSEAATRAAADTAFTNQINSMTITINGHTASITAQSGLIGTVQGDVATLFGRWGVEIDVNGYGSGFALNNNGTRSDAVWRVDKFAVGAPGAGTQYPFQVVGSTTYMKNAMIQDASITNAKIANLAVDTLKIANQAVTVPVGAYTAASIGFAQGVWTTVQSVSIVASGAPIYVQASCHMLQGRSGGFANNQMRIVRNGVVVYGPIDLPTGYTPSGSAYSGPVSFSGMDQPGAGSFTYELQLYRDVGTLDMSHRSLSLTEFKK
ncbi:hypothetical protein [Sphingobium fuliginis]|jgi:hypothetical protein|uniref:phage tail tip fiber protein n=1 Tax=Sphingobium fuliginis (strain ATCC 27551) TaxID=336203 RepID=UPI0037CA5266